MGEPKYIYKVVKAYGWPEFTFRSWSPYGTPGLSSNLNYRIGRLTESHPESMGIYCFETEAAAVGYDLTITRRAVLKCRYCGEINRTPLYQTASGIQRHPEMFCITVDAVIPVEIVWKHSALKIRVEQFGHPYHGPDDGMILRDNPLA